MDMHSQSKPLTGRTFIPIMALWANNEVKGKTMHLPPEQVERFYHIWFALLRFVNDQRQLVSDVPMSYGEGALSPSDAMQLRNALWADETLRERFIATNPADLSSLDLALVESWRYRKAGSFYIFRTLKAYTVFLSDRAPKQAYGVLGLVSSFEELVPVPLPVYAEAVLLPFEGKIIYDGLLQPYAVSFGPNIRRGLNEAYRNAKEREGVITSLVPVVPASLDEQRTLIEGRNAKLLQAFRQHLLKAGLSLKIVERDMQNIQAFAQATLAKQDPPQGLLSITPTELQAYLHTAKEKSTPTSFKRFVRFLADTERMEFEQTQALLQVFK